MTHFLESQGFQNMWGSGGVYKEISEVTSDDLTEWTGESIPDFVRKADDRLAFRRFVYEVAHARMLGTAP